jgi:hypothetical protein
MDAYISSRGEMKISLKLMICPASEFAFFIYCLWVAHILVSEMLEELQFAVGALRQDRSAEGLHDLLDSHGLAGELILGRTALMLACNAIVAPCKHTRQDQKLPCQRAAGQCIFAASVPPTIIMWGIAAPARDFKRRAENLGAHKFSHGGVRWCEFCDRRGLECLWRRCGGGDGAVVRFARQQVCAVGEPDRAASRIGSVGIAARRGEHSKKVEGTLDCAETAQRDGSGFERRDCSSYASLMWWSGQQTRARSAGE